MTINTTTNFDLEDLCRAVEGRDPDAQLARYGPEVRVTIVDRVNQPGSPLVLHGRDEVATWIRDICGRDTTHSVTTKVAGAHAAAFVTACRNADGTRVLCATVLQIAGGLILDQTVVQAWDE